ncbi:serine/threonine-protein phosphatase pp2a-related [Anaeramoeba flamelloides]|uniref:Serine/threonine-protein phosphatase n=1 Tax=Anaeramoeba flamelloides TaxID=1746091 RepID=A0AAV8A9S2_9EUKA|nr:serine/threonine-protein phosphatase pp2a-related [Anaeramoeba flamelloides]
MNTKKLSSQIQDFSQILDSQIKDLESYNLLPTTELIQLCERAKLLFVKEPNMLKIDPPVVVCGDIHGQFPDLLSVFQFHGSCKDQKYLFLGDYVDRGKYSIECISFLLALKVRHPNNIYLLRGNHECRSISKAQGFRKECRRKYPKTNIWEIFVDLFDYLPLCATIGDSFFAVHGGLSPDIQKIETIQSIDRFREPPIAGPMADLLWSDPDDRIGFAPNVRGAGWTFGKDITSHFLQTNNLSMVIRAHQMVMQGFRQSHSQLLITIFTAPHCSVLLKNLASVLTIDKNLKKKIFQFQESKGEKNNKQRGYW